MIDNTKNNDDLNQQSDKNREHKNQVEDFELKLTIYRKEVDQLSEHEQHLLNEIERLEGNEEKKAEYEELFNELDSLMKSREDIQKQVESYASLIEGLDQDLAVDKSDQSTNAAEQKNRLTSSIGKALELSDQIENTFNQLNIQGGYTEEELKNFPFGAEEKSKQGDDITDEERELVNRELSWTEVNQNAADDDNKKVKEDSDLSEPESEPDNETKLETGKEDKVKDETGEVSEKEPETQPASQEIINENEPAGSKHYEDSVPLDIAIDDLGKLQGDLDQIITSMNETIESLGENAGELPTINDDISDAAENLQQTLTRLKSFDISGESEKIAHLKQTAHEEINVDLNDLRKEIRELEERNAILKEEVDARERKSDELKSQNEKLNEIEDLDAKLEYLTQKDSSLEDKIKSREEQLERLESKVSSYYDEHKRLDEITLGKKEQHKEMQKLLESLREEEAKMQDKNDLIKDKIEENQQHLVSIKEEAGFILERLTRIKKEEQTKKKDLENIDGKVKSNEKLKNTLEKNISELLSELNEKIGRYDDYQRRNENLEKELDIKQNKINSISDQIAEKSNYIRGMKENIVALEHSKSNYQNVLKRLMGAREELEDHLLNVGHSLKNLGKKLDSSAHLLQDFNPGKLLVGGTDTAGSERQEPLNRDFHADTAPGKPEETLRYKDKIFELSDVGNIITLLESGAIINKSDPKLLDILNEFESKIKQFITLVKSDRVAVSDDEFATAQLINNYLRNIREAEVTDDMEPPSQQDKDKFLPAAMNIISKLDRLFAGKQVDTSYTQSEPESTYRNLEDESTDEIDDLPEPERKSSFINKIVPPAKEENEIGDDDSSDPSVTFEVFSDDEEETIDYIEENEDTETVEEIPPDVISKTPGKSPDDVSILYAEDNKYVQMIVNNILQRNGFKNVLVVNDGQQALDAAKEDKFDIFLVDLYMPVKDGFELIRELRKLPPYEETPIIAVSAFPMQSDKDKYLESGATDYITKPINKKEFIDKLNKLLHLS